jgi:hypothetical protein
VYNFDSAGSGSTAIATVTASGDLDGDGIASTYRMTVMPDDKLEAVPATNLERVDPEE